MTSGSDAGPPPSRESKAWSVVMFECSTPRSLGDAVPSFLEAFFESPIRFMMSAVSPLFFISDHSICLGSPFSEEPLSPLTKLFSNLATFAAGSGSRIGCIFRLKEAGRGTLVSDRIGKREAFTLLLREAMGATVEC